MKSNEKKGFLYFYLGNINVKIILRHWKTSLSSLFMY